MTTDYTKTIHGRDTFDFSTKEKLVSFMEEHTIEKISVGNFIFYKIDFPDNIQGIRSEYELKYKGEYLGRYNLEAIPEIMVGFELISGEFDRSNFSRQTLWTLLDEVDKIDSNKY